VITLECSDLHLVNNSIKIKILGVGGAGCNAVENLLKENFIDVEYFVLNTDNQALFKNKVQHKIQLGTKTIAGIGTGANPEIGKMAAEEDIEALISLIDDANIVFLVGGLGGGTGSGALPVIAKILQEKQILSIALVTKPFIFEGTKRMNIAQQALEKLEQLVDTLLVIPNQKLFEADSEKQIPLIDAFGMVNDLICTCIKTVVETIQKPGHINVDFADIKTTMTRMGKAVMGIGKASGQNRAQEAINKAISSPLLEFNSLKGARSILLNVSGNSKMSLHEISIIASYVHDQAHPEAHIIVGSAINENLEDELSVTLIATGFDDVNKIRINQRQTNFNGGYQHYTNQNAGYVNHSRMAQSSQKDYSTKTIQNQPSMQSSQEFQAQSGVDNIEIPALLRKLMQEQNQQ
jgi:cell division protein FtsZ